MPDMIVIHYTAMQSAAAACNTLCNPETEVSAHYLIGEDGTLMSLVPEEMRAWHAGAGAWGSVTDVNSRSIGIELANTGTCPFAHAQIEALIILLEGIRSRWAIPAERIIGHSDMAPGRKIDPGSRFDWRRLWLMGQGVWYQDTGNLPIPTDPVVFRTDALAFGYPDVTDALLLQTLRLRFRPWAKGPLDATDMAIIADLADRFPVDASPLTA